MFSQLFPTFAGRLTVRQRALADELGLHFYQALPGKTRIELLARLGSPAWHLLAASPVLHKLGQVLARDRRVWPDLRQQLRPLESLDLAAQGPFDGQPLAQGSLALVYRLEVEGRPAVAKVLKPGIKSRLEEELAALDSTARLLRRRAPGLGLPSLDYRGTLRRVRQLLLAEVDLQGERRNLREAHRFYTSPRLVIPRLLPWPDPEVLVMEHLEGGPVQPCHADVLVEELLVRPLLGGLPLHGDLHAGNLLSMEDGRVGVIDWGLRVDLSPHQRAALIRLMLASLLGNQWAASLALQDLGVRTPARSGSGRLMGRLDAMLDGAVDELPGWLVVLRKTLQQLDGVVTSLGADFDRLLVRDAGLVAFAELPYRLTSLPTSRAYPSRLSNYDLLSLLGSGLM